VSFYLLKEDGGKIQLEDGTGSLLLEEVAIPGPSVDWQAGGAGYPVKQRKRRNETEELFRKIEHSLAVALGLAEEPVEVTAGAVETPRAIQTDDAAAIRRSYEQLLQKLSALDNARARMDKLGAMLRAYEEAQERERIEEEEAWILMA
jgi:hypothetical protein